MAKEKYDYGYLRYRWYRIPEEFLCWMKTRHNYVVYGSMAGIRMEECSHCGKERFLVLDEKSGGKNSNGQRF